MDVGSLWASEAQHYREVAKDAQTESSDLEQAANLYVAADGCLQTGETAKALAKAKQALPLFRATEVEQGVADIICLTVHAHCLADERKEASKVVLEELNRGSRDQKPRATLLLASAEVNCDGRGNKKREEALQASRQALAIFRELEDTRGVAKALLAQVAVHAKRKCGNEEKAMDVLRLTREAQPIFKGLGDQHGEAQILHFVGVAFGLKQMYQDAIRATSESRDLFRLTGDGLLEAHEAHLLALLNLEEQDTARAVTAADAALRLLRGLGSHGPQETEVARTLVRAHIANHEGQQALMVAQSCLMRAQILLDKRMEVEALLLVSHAHMNLDPVEELPVQPCPLEALQSAERALGLAKGMKDEDTEAKIMALLAKLHVLRQDFEEASAAAKLAVERAGAKDLEAEGAELQAAATAHLNKGELQEALQKAHEAKSFFGKQKYPQGEASSLLLISQVHFEQGQVDTAVSETKEAQVIYQDLDDKKGIGEALMQIAEFRNASKEHARALHAADRARAHVQRYGDKVMEARMLLLAAQNRTFLLVRKQEDAEAEQRKAGYAFAAGWEEVAKATAAARSAVKFSEELSDSAGVGSALTVVAQMYVFTQRFDHALAAAEEAVLRFVEVGDARSEAAVLVLQAQIHLALGSFKKSLSLARQGHLLFRDAGDAQGEAIAKGVLAGLRKFEFVVDERSGAAVPPSALEAEEQLAVSAGPASQALDAGYVAEQIQSVTRKMVGAGEDTIISADNPLMDIGITSMNAVLFRNKLGQEFEGVDLPVTLVFDFPTIRDLTSLVVDRSRD